MSEVITIEKTAPYMGVSGLQSLVSETGERGTDGQRQPVCTGLPVYRMSSRPGRNAMLRMMGIVAVKN